VAGTITFNNVVSRLLEAVPEFQPDTDDVAENLVYLVFPDLMRFVKRALEGSQSEVLPRRVFAFLEEAVLCQDPDINEMLRDALFVLAIPDPDRPKALMGPATRKLFRKVEKEVYK
jgi:hypothetical protein